MDRERNKIERQTEKRCTDKLARQGGKGRERSTLTITKRVIKTRKKMLGGTEPFSRKKGAQKRQNNSHK